MTPKFTVTNLAATTPTPKSVIKRLPNQQSKSTWDFFAKCPHRLACARCPFYLPKQSSSGQLLQVKDGIDHMLENLILTDEERDALEGDRDAVTQLANRLATLPTPAGSTPEALGTTAEAFIALSDLQHTLRNSLGETAGPSSLR